MTPERLDRRQERVLAAPKALDLQSRQAFQRQALDLLEAMRPGEGRLVLDLARVRFVDSTGVRALISVQRRARDLRHAVKLTGAGAELRSLLVAARVWGLFEVE